MDVLDPVFPLQVRAARTLLGWNQTQLAEYADVSQPFVARLERGVRLGQARKLRQLRDALVELGIEFISTPDGFGVTINGGRAQQLRTEWER